MNDCIFCRIVKGEIPCSKVYEDSAVIAFLDIAPTNKGHTLVIPKKHYETMLDTPTELLARIITSVKYVASGVKKGTGCAGFNVIQNNFRISGQLVPHIHFHIIPRVDGDGLKLWPQGKYADGETEAYKDRIKQALDKPALSGE